MKGNRRVAAVFVLLIVFPLLPSCGKPDSVPVKLRSISSVQTTPQPEAPSLRIGITPVISPRESFPLYLQLQSYLEKRLKRSVMILHRSTYAEVNNLLRFGQCDMAFVCGYPYVQGNHDFGLEALIAPVVNGQTVYYSYIIIPARSSKTSLKELRGSVFAFSDPLSNSGRLAPEYALVKMGERAETFFQRVVYTYSHDRSVRAVAAATVDGAAVDSLVFDQMAAKEPSLRTAIRIVDRLGPFGIPPVVVRPKLDLQVKETLRTSLIHMHESSEGRQVLQQLGIERFSPADDSAYDSIREMAQVLGELP